MEVEGSYTVEAAFLMPFILLIIVGILQLGFRVHDDFIIMSAAFEGAAMGANGAELEAWRVIPPDVSWVRKKTVDKLDACILKWEVGCETDDQEDTFFITMKQKGELRAQMAKPFGANYVRKINRIVRVVKGLSADHSFTGEGAE